MDYKEKYEQALERAKKFYNRELYAECNGCLVEYIFPELKESDDEKIRKNIISWLKNIEGQTIPINDYNSAIAWVEKIGNQPNKVSIWKHWKDGIAGNGEGKQVYLIKNGTNYSVSSCLGYECDYIELSELDNILSQGKQDKQKQEWSEEDEDALDIAIRIIQNGGDDCAGILDSNKALNLLKSLKERMKGE